MKKLIKFPSINQFNAVVKEVRRKYEWIGNDENGDPMYDETLPKPTLAFKGTVKLHGTNAGVVYKNDDIYAQSRERLISVEDDNAGFAKFVKENEEAFRKLFQEVFDNNVLADKDSNIVIYGEWAGSNIMKGTAINNIEKSFFIFGVKIKPDHEDSKAYWVEFDYLRNQDSKIFNINDFPTYEITIDFNKPLESLEALETITHNVEEECPVGKYFGFSGIGEGVVWTARATDKTNIPFDSDLRFKVKGEKHSKVKTPKVKVEDPFENEKIELAEILTPSWRLEQGLNEVFNLNNGNFIDRKGLGKYIKWVLDDIIKEESETISESKFQLKDLNKYISEISKNYFMEEEKNQL